MDNQTDISIDRRRLRVPLHLPSRRQSYATSGRAQLIARRRRIAIGFAVLVIGLALSAQFRTHRGGSSSAPAWRSLAT